MSKEHTIIPTAERQWHEGIYENTEMCYLWEEASSERRAFAQNEARQCYTDA